MISAEVQFANPGALMVTWYAVPGSRSLNSKNPLSFDATVREPLSTGPLRVTVAPGMASSFTSTAVPTIIPSSADNNSQLRLGRVGQQSQLLLTSRNP